MADTSGLHGGDASMNILLTGASGLIGTALVDRLQGQGHHLICQSRRAHDDVAGIRWVGHDLLHDSWENLSLPEIDVVYHLAGQTSTYNAKQDPIHDLSVNVLAFLRLLEYFRSSDQHPFVVLAGTATEVGLPEQLPIDEDLPDHPITFYDISKLTAEQYLKQYVREGFVRGCSLRLCNVYGRSQTGQQKDRGILDKIFQRAMSGEDITVYGDGNYLRDYVFIDDVVSAFMQAPLHPERTNGRDFYIGSGQGVYLKDAFLKVASMVERSTGVKVGCQFLPPPDGLSEIEFRNAVVNPTAFTQATGWEPRHDFDSGIEAAYKERLSGLLGRSGASQ